MRCHSDLCEVVCSEPEDKVGEKEISHSDRVAAAIAAIAVGNGLKRPREEADGEVMPGAEEDGATVDALWQQIDENYHLFVPYRNKSVDRWQRKVQLSAGGAAVRGRLRALNQQRIADAEGMKSISRDEAGQRPDGVVNESALQENAVEMGVEEAGDPETFDDGEFFQQLLREFLETGKPSGGGSLSGYALKKLNKQKKLVDRRASKGRKIRNRVFASASEGLRTGIQQGCGAVQ
ncbi:hypothetical protein CBR_g1066 [Chara braunii]|uniref:Apoptosis-antagonizing transcription factor C-terminal domain-containing protein n=1 Tax=Chara braunii TaxID=69332 RepID=A0A388KD46_CHABU|nr:hypothetical protein CBR_g1066 [Chara braunii]|eukprot:GBG67947.1 hypothetical protein CBR_g1066 [Chara braunii]